MVTFPPPRCADCGRLPREPHQSWCPASDAAVVVVPTGYFRHCRVTDRILEVTDHQAVIQGGITYATAARARDLAEEVVRDNA